MFPLRLSFCFFNLGAFAPLERLFSQIPADGSG